MENKRLLELQEKLKNNIALISEAKQRVGFDGIIKDYAKVKKQIWKTNKAIEDSQEETEITKLKDELKLHEDSKAKMLSSLKAVELEERKLYSLKISTDSYIKQMDNKKNSVDARIKSNENRISDLAFFIDEKNKTDLEKQIKSFEDEISETTKEIDLRKAKEKQTSDLNAKNEVNRSKIYLLKAKLNKFNSVNDEYNRSEIEKLTKANEELISESTIYEKDISELLEIINTINEALSFIDADEVNTKSSFTVKHLNVWYGNKQALFDINLELPKNKVISIIGPSGCGKSTFLRTLNRINDNIPSFKAKGKILLDGEYDIFKLKSIRNRYDKMELSTLRTKVGMIFQQPNPFPMSIAKNVQYGPKVKGIKNKSILNELTEQSLKDAGIWEEVKDNLKALGTSLSGGQQQRLCIARAIANEPEILLMDEPTSALDPIAAKIIEDLILKLKKHYTIIMVTHSMQQAQRISDHTAFFYQGNLIEYGTTKQIFESPKEKETKEYISGKFG